MSYSTILTWLVTSMLLVSPVSGEEPSKDDLDKHRGTWGLVSEEIDGKSTPQSELKGITRVVRGDHVTRKAGGITGRSILRLDSSKQPKQYDAEIVEGPGKGKTIRGIYAFDGDRLWMCADLTGKGRPDVFTTSPGSGRSLQVWKRTEP